MVFESPTGIDRNRKVQLALGILLATLATLFYFYTRSNQPATGIVNGVYHNECCVNITIDNQHIYQNGKSSTIKLRNMKFGLTGYVGGQFTKDGLQDSNEETAIAFQKEGNRWVLSVPIDRHDHVFRSTEIKKAGTAR